MAVIGSKKDMRRSGRACGYEYPPHLNAPNSTFNPDSIMSFQPPFEQPPGRNPPPPNTRGACWPDLGVQMDLNTLWEYVNSLSQLHEGIRAQTQSVLHGVQTIQARAGQESSSPIAAQVNGAINGKNDLSSLLEFLSTFEVPFPRLQMRFRLGNDLSLDSMVIP